MGKKTASAGAIVAPVVVQYNMVSISIPHIQAHNIDGTCQQITQNSSSLSSKAFRFGLVGGGSSSSERATSSSSSARNLGRFACLTCNNRFSCAYCMQTAQHQKGGNDQGHEQLSALIMTQAASKCISLTCGKQAFHSAVVQQNHEATNVHPKKFMQHNMHWYWNRMSRSHAAPLSYMHGDVPQS